MRTTSIKGINNVFYPSREDVLNLKVGDLAPDYAGRMRKVVEIYGRGMNPKGQAFVCYYVTHGEGDTRSRVSDSLVEDRLHRDINLTRANTSADLDRAEALLAQN